MNLFFLSWNKENFHDRKFNNNDNNNIKNDQASLLPNCGIVKIKIRELINVSINRMKKNVREIKEKKIRKRNQH